MTCTGEREVTAGDIKQDSDIEILNPEHHIATLSEVLAPLHGAHLRPAVADMFLRSATSSSIHSDGGITAPSGLFITDSIYTPVYNVKLYR